MCDQPAGEEKQHGASQWSASLNSSSLRLTGEVINVFYSAVLSSVLSLLHLQCISSQVRDVAKGMAVIAPVGMSIS